MAIRGDSFGSVAEVVALTAHLLDGQSTFNTTTRPTGTQVEKFIDRASSHINVCLAGAGFTPSIVYANSTAKLIFDDWVVNQAVIYTELTQRGTGYSGQEESRIGDFRTLHADACALVDLTKKGLAQIGVAQGIPASAGLVYTGLDRHSQRDDPDDQTREQPVFRRRLFDEIGTYDTYDASDAEDG